MRHAFVNPFDAIRQERQRVVRQRPQIFEHIRQNAERIRQARSNLIESLDRRRQAGIRHQR